MNLRTFRWASYYTSQDDLTGTEIKMVRVQLTCGHKVRWKDDGKKYVAINCAECEIGPVDWLDWLKAGIKESKIYQKRVLGHLNQIKPIGE